MKVTDLPLEGLKLVENQVFRDERGFFIERFNSAAFEKAGLPCHFVQDNHSLSRPGVLRGLHFQFDPPQGKFVGVIRGRIWDVVVDLRPFSKSYGRHFGIELSAENGSFLWVPAGFAHGFCVLGDEPADVLYKVDALYNAKGEAGIVWNDPDFNIPWPVKKPVVSERDGALPTFRDIEKKMLIR